MQEFDLGTRGLLSGRLASASPTGLRPHLATRVVLSALQGLRGMIVPAGPSGMKAICCGIEGDLHELPVHLAEIILESEGWDTRNLGPNTPLFSLREMVTQQRPQLVCISARSIPDLDRATSDYAQLRKVTADRNGSLGCSLKPLQVMAVEAQRAHVTSTCAFVISAKCNDSFSKNLLEPSARTAFLIEKMDSPIRYDWRISASTSLSLPRRSVTRRNTPPSRVSRAITLSSLIE